MNSCVRLRNLTILVLAVCLGACGSDGDSAPPPIAVLSAFPGEMAPLLAQATIDETVVVGDRVFRIGKLGTTPVILGLTGIGLLNAEATTALLLDRWEVRGVVVSAVAGGPRIADVVVPEAWAFSNGERYPADSRWLALARTIAAAGTVSLEHCTLVPQVSPDVPVCLAFEPAIVVGGVGESSDTFGSTPYACQPGGGDILGCDPALSGHAGSASDPHAMGGSAEAGAAAPIANDMETAAIAREATARGIPYIAFRGVSDGAGDPLNLPPFPFQFAAYYRLAARNAAAATVEFLKRLPAS